MALERGRQKPGRHHANLLRFFRRDKSLRVGFVDAFVVLKRVRLRVRQPLPIVGGGLAERGCLREELGRDGHERVQVRARVLPRGFQ